MTQIPPVRVVRHSEPRATAAGAPSPVALLALYPYPSRSAYPTFFVSIDTNGVALRERIRMSVTCVERAFRLAPKKRRPAATSRTRFVSSASSRRFCQNEHVLPTHPCAFSMIAGPFRIQPATVYGRLNRSSVAARRRRTSSPTGVSVRRDRAKQREPGASGRFPPLRYPWRPRSPQ